MLKNEIDEAKRTVSTDTVQITIGEIANMYSSRELNILPDFQRLFRWSNDRKSNFIESILIGIPIPPAFVYENEDGSWELVDGLQRLSTILEFMGILLDLNTGEKRRSKLIKTKYLPSLENVVWHQEEPEEVELDKTLQLFFRRHRIDFQILKHPSNPKTKYDLFQRLNRGGAYANEQEVRTCSMVLANPEFTRKIREFSIQSDFQGVFQITEEQKKNQTDLAYAVRLIVHTYKDFTPDNDVQEFLDHQILNVITEYDANEVLSRIGWSIEVLHRLFGDNALIPPEGRPEGIARRFSLRALEGIVVGLARNKDAIIAMTNSDDFIRAQVTGFWQQDETSAMSTPGLRGTARLQRTIPFGARWFAPHG